MKTQKTKRSRHTWAAGQVLERIDSFGETLPVFNIKGKDKINTKTGGLVTLLITGVVLLFAAIKFSHLYTKFNPQMS